jgi:hypothetical protein
MPIDQSGILEIDNTGRMFPRNCKSGELQQNKGERGRSFFQAGIRERTRW